MPESSRILDSVGLIGGENLSGILIRDSHVIEECILFFPLNSDTMQLLNICILYAKYYIDIQRLFNSNTFDLHACLTQLKQALKNRRKYIHIK